MRRPTELDRTVPLRIHIHVGEGRYWGQWTQVDTFAAANVFLNKVHRSAPRGGGYDKG